MGASVGVDSHKATLSCVAVDDLACQIDAKEFENSGVGHRRLSEWLMTLPAPRVVGIEGSGKFGAALARNLIESGETVMEVPPTLAYRERRRHHAKGKSDVADALAIARVVARGEAVPTAQRSPIHEELRLLSDYRQQLVRTRTQLANRIHSDLVALVPGYQASVKSLARKRSLTAAVTLVRGNTSLRADLVRRRIRAVRQLDLELAELRRTLVSKLKESGSNLATLRGVGPLTAARILGEVGDVRRIKSKAAFAQMNGTAPLQASSGQSQRHRLNRGGNREMNCAIHFIALAQYRTDPSSRAYVQNCRERGKSFKESIRCLKRQISNSLYRQMVADAQSVSSGP